MLLDGWVTATDVLVLGLNKFTQRPNEHFMLGVLEINKSCQDRIRLQPGMDLYPAQNGY